MDVIQIMESESSTLDVNTLKQSRRYSAREGMKLLFLSWSLHRDQSFHPVRQIQLLVKNQRMV